jgi:hypothetical protein
MFVEKQNRRVSDLRRNKDGLDQRPQKKSKREQDNKPQQAKKDIGVSLS